MNDIDYVLLEVRSKYDVNKLGDNPLLARKGQEAANDPEFEIYTTLFACYTRATGEEFRWFEGCWCHAAVRAAYDTDAKRRRAMMEDETTTPLGLCPWGGKRLTGLALGHSDGMTTRVRSCSSPKLTASMFALTPEKAQTIMLAKVHITERWCSIVQGKFQYVKTLPFKIAGCFGEYAGYGLPAAKQCVRECFQDFDAMDLAHVDPISKFLFSRESLTSQQFWQFTQDPLLHLHELPEAFVEGQERSFASSWERPTEGQHKGIKNATSRGFRYTQPGVADVRFRKPQIEEMMEVPEQYEFVLENWQSRSIYKTLLSHVGGPQEVNRWTHSQRMARIFSYGSKDHFGDIKEQALSIRTASSVTLQVAKRGHVQPTPSMALIIAYLKNIFTSTSVFSLPTPLFNAAQRDPLLVAPPAVTLERVSSEAIVATVPVEMPASELTFFKVVDPRPEAKYQKQLTSAAVSRTTIVVKLVTFLRDTASGSEVEVSTAPPVLVDLSYWASLEHYQSVMDSLRVWQTRPGDLALQLALPASHAAPGVVHMPSDVGAVDDDDMLADLVEYVDPVGEELALPIGNVAIECVGFTLSRQAIGIVQDLVRRNAFSEFSRSTYIMNLENCSQAAVTELVAAGLVEHGTSMFGESNLSLNLASGRLVGVLRVVSPIQAKTMPSALGFKKWSKIEMAQELCRSGWQLTPSADVPVFSWMANRRCYQLTH